MICNLQALPPVQKYRKGTSHKFHDRLYQHQSVHGPQQIRKHHQRQVKNPFPEKGQYKCLLCPANPLKHGNQHKFYIDKRHLIRVKAAPYSMVAASEIKNLTSHGADSSTTANMITETASPAASE